MQLEFLRLDFGKIENVVDEVEQRAAAGGDRREVGAGARIRDQRVEEIRKPENRIHRRANLVAHVGEELALGAVRLVGRVARLAQRPLRLLALGDVRVEPERAHPLAGVVVKIEAVRLDPDVMPLAMPHAELHREADARPVVARPPAQSAAELGEVVGVEQFHPDHELVRQFQRLVAEHLLPARREVALAGLQVDVEKSQRAALDEQREALLALDQFLHGRAAFAQVESALEAEIFLLQFLIVDVGAGADPLHDAALGVAARQGEAEMPAVLFVAGAPQAVLELERFAGFHRRLPAVDEELRLVLMHDAAHRLVAQQADLRGVEPGVLHPARVDVLEFSVGRGRPDDVRHGVREEVVALGGLGQRLGRAPLRIDVARAADHAHDPALFVAHGLADVHHPAIGAVGHPDAALDAVGRAVLEVLAQRGAHARQIVRVHARLPRLEPVGILVRLEIHHLLEARRIELLAAHQIDVPDGVARRADGELVALLALAQRGGGDAQLGHARLEFGVGVGQLARVDLDAPFQSGAAPQARGGAVEQARRPERRRAPQQQVQKLQRRENVLDPAERAGGVARQNPGEIESQAGERDRENEVAETPEEAGQARGRRGAVDQDFRLGPVERHVGIVPESTGWINDCPRPLPPPCAAPAPCRRPAWLDRAGPQDRLR